MSHVVTNLMVTDVAESVAFYRDVLGFKVVVRVPVEGEVLGDNEPDQSIIFATLSFRESELMLQSQSSFSEEAPGVKNDAKPGATASLYLRVTNFDELVERLGEAVITEPKVSWYGMKEVWAKDPDGYLLTIGQPEGPPPS